MLLCIICIAGNNLSIYENVSINAAAPIRAVDAEGFPVTFSIPLYSVNSDKFCMKDNTSGLIYVCRGVILDREVGTGLGERNSIARFQCWAGFVNMCI